MWRNTKALIIFGFCLGLIIVPNFVSATWANDSFSYKRKFTIDHTKIDEDLSDFPILVVLNSTNIDYSKTQDAGQDIRFYNGSENTQLKYEIEKWNESGNSYVWVKIDSISSSTDTDFYIYYGNDTISDGQDKHNTWNNNYMAVWHQKDGSDSTANERTLSITGATPTSNNYLDGGYDYSADSARMTRDENLFASRPRTVTVATEWSNQNTEYGHLVSANYGRTYINYYYGKAQAVYYTGSEYVKTTSDAIPSQSFVVITGVFNASGVDIYVNGTHKNSTTGASDEMYSSAKFALGVNAYDYSSRDYDGKLFEVRIMNEASSPAWIKADYYSMTNQLLSFGSEQTPEVDEITITDLKENPSDPATYSYGATYQFNATICDTEGAGNISSVKFEWSGSNTTITDYATINATCREYYTSKSDLGVDTYNYKWYAEDTTNSLYDSESGSYTVNKASSSCSLSFDPSSPIDYGNAFKASCACSGASDEGGTTKLYRNDTDVTSENNTNVTLGAGTYNYVCNVTSTENYTSASDSANYVINPIDAGLSLSSSAGWFIYENEQTVLACSATTNASVKLKIEDSFVSNPYTLTGEIGEYTVNCLTEDTQNYTSTEINNTLIVNPLISCTDNETFAFEINISTSSDITTLNFTDLVNNNYVRDNLGDVIAINVSDEWINTTDGYYFVVNNTGLSEFTVRFGNYFVNNSYSTHSTSNIKNVTDYTQINPYVIYKIRDELTGELMFPPNATLSSIIAGSKGETYIPIENNDTKFLIATNEYVDKVSLRILYTADMYYSRQIYPSEADQTIFDAYVVDAQEHALDRIDFLMEDMNYYDSKLQIYKNLGNSTIIITEGYFDISHYFSAYLMEDTDYYLRTIDSTNGITEFGRLTVVSPAEKVLSKATINLNPQAVLIGDYLLMNAYTDDNRTTLYIQYNDDLNETDNVTIAVLFGNGTVWQNHTYYANSVNTEYNITDYNDTDFTVTFTVYHQTFGNSPVTYTMGIFAPVFWDLGFSSGLYNLISLAVLVIIGGITTRRSLIAGILIFSIAFILFVALGWLTAGGWILFSLIMIVGVLSIINYLQGGAE